MPGGFTQPKPPPSMIAADVASHSACRSSSVNSVMRSISRCAGSGVASSAIASRGPEQEVAEYPNADLLALLDMELRAGTIADRHHRHHWTAVFSHRDRFLGVSVDQRIAVHEVHVVARLETIKKLVASRNEIQCIPAHLRQPQAWRRHLGDLAADPAEPWSDLMLQSALRHKLHPDTDAQERRAGSGRLLDGLTHAVHRLQPMRAVGEGALAGQHDPVGRRDIVWVCRYPNLGAQSGAISGQRERPRGRGKVPTAVVHHGNLHMRYRALARPSILMGGREPSITGHPEAAGS